MKFSIRWKLAGPIIAGGFIIGISTYFTILGSAVEQVENSSLRDAKVLSRYVAELRTYYSKNVVKEAKAAGVIISHQHADIENTVPLPATMVHDLNQLVGAKGDGASIKLFSYFPFPWRKEGGLIDSADKLDWQTLNRSPETPNIQRVTLHGEPAIRYSTADRMTTQACVDCHNSHPQSPRVGWKIGDVRGVLAVTIPMGQSLGSAKADAKNAIFGIAIVICGVIGIILFIARKSLFVPLNELRTAAREVSNGNLHLVVNYQASDELGDLANSFRSAGDYLNRMSRAISELGEGTLASQLEPVSPTDGICYSINRANSLLSEREMKIRSQNDTMRCIMDNVQQGLLTVTGDGMIQLGHSTAVESWFGNVTPIRVWEYFSKTDTTFGEWLRVGWQAIQDGWLPLEVTLEQLPVRIHKDRTYEVQYKPLVHTTSPDSTMILLVITDVTDVIVRESETQQQSEALALFKAISSDRTATIEFLDECNAMINKISRDDELTVQELKRLIHTIKGNCASYAVTTVATACHHLEEHAIDNDGYPLAEDVQTVVSAWRVYTGRTQFLVESDTTHAIIITSDELAEAFLMAKDANSPFLAAALQRWWDPVISPRLERLGQYALNLASRLNKEIQVVVDGPRIRLPAQKLRPLWMALVHPIRNAVDHGFESADERARRGKPAEGTLCIGASIERQALVITIRDDGRGVMWDKLKENAELVGRTVLDRNDLVTELIRGGISSKDVADDISGRGVGMSAAAEAVTQLGGTWQISSEPNSGTLWQCRIPVVALIATDDHEYPVEEFGPTQEGHRPDHTYSGYSNPTTSAFVQ